MQEKVFKITVKMDSNNYFLLKRLERISLFIVDLIPLANLRALTSIFFWLNIKPANIKNTANTCNGVKNSFKNTTPKKIAKTGCRYKNADALLAERVHIAKLYNA